MLMPRRHSLLLPLIAVAIGFIVPVAAGKPAVASNLSDPGSRGADAVNTEKAVVHLYFSDKENGFLKSEERVLRHPNDPTLLGRNIIDELLRGPQEGLAGTIPAGTSLKAFYLTRAGIAYVDMSPEIRDAHPGGIESELLTIYSVVNSLVLNIPEIKAVKILIDGNESQTLAGHVDLRFPFKANMLLIR